MRPLVYYPLISLLTLWPLLLSANSHDADSLRTLLSRSSKPIHAPSPSTDLEAAKITLGKTLYFDPRLSLENTHSCNSCHQLSTYGTNGSAYSALREEGYDGRDVPSIYNTSALHMFDWDGRHQTLSEKIDSAISSTDEMSFNNPAKLEQRFNAIKGYQALYRKAYNSDRITYPQIIDALEAFISELVTPAPIDDFILGDDSALSQKQIQGGHTFINHDCYTCHTGSHFGGQMLQRIGIAEEWPNQTDTGYYQNTQIQAQRMFFRVSPLRNVEKTAPYFHDASSTKVWDAARKMAFYERGHRMSTSDATLIQEFLKSLTGTQPAQHLIAPELPQ